MCARIIGAIKRGAFQHWMSRLGLAASLLLVLVPTLGRVAQAAAPHAVVSDLAVAVQRNGRARLSARIDDLGFAPVTKIEDGMADFVAWFRAYQPRF